MNLKPGSKVGIIGGGQLGRMFILEAKRLGYGAVVLGDKKTAPAAQVADEVFSAQEWKKFTEVVSCATYEFEHVDLDVVKKVASRIPVFPGMLPLKIKQDKIEEKLFLKNNGFPTAEFRVVDKSETILEILRDKHKVVVKKPSFCYDGKGLFVIRSLQDFKKYSPELTGRLLVEDFIQYDRELSIMCARDRKGNSVLYPVTQNIHWDGILFYNIAPAPISESAKKWVEKIAKKLLSSLSIVGILGIEFFLLKNGTLLINEFAPRPHNSGHYTQDACDISQFEILLRVMCGMPLITPKLNSEAIMLNILGVEQKNLPLDKILSLSGVKLHNYGKIGSGSRRKMGHINIIGQRSENIKKLNLLKKSIYSVDD